MRQKLVEKLVENGPEKLLCSIGEVVVERALPRLGAQAWLKRGVEGRCEALARWGGRERSPTLPRTKCYRGTGPSNGPVLRASKLPLQTVGIVQLVGRQA
jgi:hypothetical protein